MSRSRSSGPVSRSKGLRASSTAAARAVPVRRRRAARRPAAACGWTTCRTASRSTRNVDRSRRCRDTTSLSARCRARHVQRAANAEGAGQVVGRRVGVHAGAASQRLRCISPRRAGCVRSVAAASSEARASAPRPCFSRMACSQRVRRGRRSVVIGVRSRARLPGPGRSVSAVRPAPARRRSVRSTRRQMRHPRDRDLRPRRTDPLRLQPVVRAGRARPRGDPGDRRGLRARGPRDLPANVAGRSRRSAASAGGRARGWPAFALRPGPEGRGRASTRCAVAALARRLRPDVIHLHCTNPIALVYLWLLRRLRVPLVATAHVVTPHERISLPEGRLPAHPPARSSRRSPTPSSTAGAWSRSSPSIPGGWS